ncbi:MAG TPA: SPOR domain-containing protein [Thermodesulfobacteriota bacterium]|nr:SPOR domain-containing protein [Thermodesulfobacteriota bacterium]
MYCPRCNLHSEEYVDKCPLCAGSMEVDELGSGLMKTPAMPGKERTDAFPKEESLELNEEDFGEGTDVNSISGLELEQEKIMEEAKTLEEVNEQLPDEEPGDEKTVPSLREEEYLFDQKEQLYQQEIPRHSGGKKLSPLFISIGILIILVLIGGGYFYFFQSGESPLLKKMKVALSKKETTFPQPVVSPQAPVAEKQKEPSETISTQPEEVKPPLVSEKTEKVLPKKTGAEKPEITKPATPKQESKKPVASQKSPEALITKPEPQKEETSPVSPAPAKPQEKPTMTKASKDTLSKTKEITLPAPIPAGQYSIMVGAFKVEQNARDLQNTLQKKGYPVTSHLIDLPGKGSWYRVIVGNYADLKETRMVASKLKSEEKIPALIMKDGKYL